MGVSGLSVDVNTSNRVKRGRIEDFLLNTLNQETQMSANNDF